MARNLISVPASKVRMMLEVFGEHLGKGQVKVNSKKIKGTRNKLAKVLRKGETDDVVKLSRIFYTNTIEMVKTILS